MKRIFILMALVLTCCGPKVNTQPFPGTIYNFGKADDHVYRGTQPFADDYKGLKKLGVKTVLNLRNDPVEYEDVLSKEAGLIYKRIAMSSSETPRIKDLQAALDILRDPTLWPVFVHCEGGRHRTGVVIAVYRVKISGWDKAKAWEEAYKYDYYRSWGHGSIEDWFLGPFKPEMFR